MNYELRIMKNAGRKERKGITQRTQRNAEERGGELITNYELRITGLVHALLLCLAGRKKKHQAQPLTCSPVRTTNILAVDFNPWALSHKKNELVKN
jgi:hypothetical protein